VQDRETKPASSSRRSRADASDGAAYLRHAGAGLQFALTFLGLGLVGWWVDQQLGSEPWLLIAGIVLGAAGGMYSLAVRLNALPRPRSGDSKGPRE